MLAEKQRGQRRPKRDKAPVENDGYEQMMARCIRALGRRVAAGDMEDVARMLRLARLLDDELDGAIRALNREGESWARIGRAAGITRQAAQQRWSR